MFYREFFHMKISNGKLQHGTYVCMYVRTYVGYAVVSAGAFKRATYYGIM